MFKKLIGGGNSSSTDSIEKATDEKHIVSAVNVDSQTDVSLIPEREYITEYADEYNPAGLAMALPEDKTLYRNIKIRPSFICMLILIVEFAERGSYYGTQGILNNFIMRPLPPGSTTGSTSEPNGSAGALGLGIKDANALVTLLQFLAYVMPLYGGWLADAKLGRYKTIMIGVWVGILAHILFVISAIPSVIDKGQAALAPLVLGILALSVCTGMIKPNLLPLLLAQVPYRHNVLKRLDTGETVLVDIDRSTESLTLIFYWSINIGGFLQIGTSYASRRVGFWLAFLVPCIAYMIVVVAMLIIGPHLTREELNGSILEKAVKVVRVCFRGSPIKRLRQGEFWSYAYPENMIERGDIYFNKKKQTPISWTIQDVNDYKSTLIQCIMFLYWVPFNLTDSGLGSSLNAQAGAMTLNGVPNDLFNNFNQITIVVAIPIVDNLFYPLLRKYNIMLRPAQKCFIGFFLGALSSMVAAILQNKIYTQSPCGNLASTCDEPAPITAWYEVIVYALAALGEVFCYTTAYEIAYTRAPDNAKGLVMSLFLFMSALSSAISEGISGALEDPHLTWVFGGLTIACAACAFIFIIHYWNLHKVMAAEALEREENRKILSEAKQIEIATLAKSISK